MIVADTHVHLYPCYDTELALRRLLSSLGEAAVEGAVAAAFLTESQGHHVFRDIQEERLQLGELRAESTPEKDAMVVVDRGKPMLYLFAGRQIVTAERLEILALGMAGEDVPDGGSATDVVKIVLDSGAVPAISWAPGKWVGRRGRAVRDLIETFGPAGLLVGDTSLRPTVCREPRLMRWARSKGLKVVAGSDPLPYPGEEAYMGVYRSILFAPFDPGKPVTSVRAALFSPNVRAEKSGARCGPFELLGRLRRHAQAKHRRMPALS